MPLGKHVNVGEEYWHTPYGTKNTKHVLIRAVASGKLMGIYQTVDYELGFFSANCGFTPVDFEHRHWVGEMNNK